MRDGEHVPPAGAGGVGGGGLRQQRRAGMAIPYRCVCGQAYWMADDRAGEVFVCTTCRQRFLVPEPARARVVPLVVPPAAEKLGRVVVVAVAALYVAACLLPVLNAPDGRAGSGHNLGKHPYGISDGWLALLFGWCPPYTIPWAANLFLPFAMERLWSRRFDGAAVLGGVALLLGLTAPHFIVMNDQPHATLLIGHKLWLAALAALPAGAVCCRMMCDRPLPPDPSAPEPAKPKPTEPFVPPEV